MPLFLKRYRRDRTLGGGSGSGGVAPVVLGGGAPTVEAVKALQQQVAELVCPGPNPIVTSQHTLTALHQFSNHIQ